MMEWGDRPFEYDAARGLYFHPITPDMLVGSQPQRAADIDILANEIGVSTILNLQVRSAAGPLGQEGALRPAVLPHRSAGPVGGGPQCIIVYRTRPAGSVLGCRAALPSTRVLSTQPSSTQTHSMKQPPTPTQPTLHPRAGGQGHEVLGREH